MIHMLREPVCEFFRVGKSSILSFNQNLPSKISFVILGGLRGAVLAAAVERRRGGSRAVGRGQAAAERRAAAAAAAGCALVDTALNTQ